MILSRRGLLLQVDRRYRHCDVSCRFRVPRRSPSRPIPSKGLAPVSIPAEGPRRPESTENLSGAITRTAPEEGHQSMMTVARRLARIFTPSSVGTAGPLHRDASWSASRGDTVADQCLADVKGTTLQSLSLYAFEPEVSAWPTMVARSCGAQSPQRCPGPGSRPGRRRT